ncbi:MAG TPA: hypothetical protein VMT19_03170 [Thermoanaerobaculaceae bacterium]|nr:hypothetical protein [Thermoanaerobaculaceae bacterium]
MNVPLRISLAVLAAVVLLGAAVAAPAEVGGPPTAQTSRQQRAPLPCMLPDLVAATLTVELLSSTKGQPGVEFPADVLRVTGTIKDNGRMMAPKAFTATLKRGDRLVASKVIPAPTSPGQVWTLVAKQVTWAHDPPNYFKFTVESGFDECTKGNNLLVVNLNDARLHDTGKLTAADPSIGGVINPGPVVIFF